MGLNFKDVNINTHSVNDILGKLQGKLKNLDDTKKNAILNAMFTTNANVMGALLDNLDKLQEKRKKIIESERAATRMAKQQLEALGGALKQLGSSLSSLAYRFLDLTPEIKSSVQGIISVLKVAAGIVDGIVIGVKWLITGIKEIKWFYDDNSLLGSVEIQRKKVLRLFKVAKKIILVKMRERSINIWIIQAGQKD